MKISNQALWYLTGLKKSKILHDVNTSGGRPEPQAMQELVNAGYATVHNEENTAIRTRYWVITQAGESFLLN